MRLFGFVVALVMLTSIVVLAKPADAPGAMKIELTPAAGYEYLSGFVILNAPDDEGFYNAVIQVRGFEDGAWVAWGVGTGDRVGEFQCNKAGNGHDTMQLETIDDLINVKWISMEGEDGPIVLTAAIP